MEKTWTLVVKMDAETDVRKLVRDRFRAYNNQVEVVLARILDANQALVLVHTLSGSLDAVFDRILATWLGEENQGAPFPAGTLLWYR